MIVVGNSDVNPRCREKSNIPGAKFPYNLWLAQTLSATRAYLGQQNKKSIIHLWLRDIMLLFLSAFRDHKNVGTK